MLTKIVTLLIALLVAISVADDKAHSGTDIDNIFRINYTGPLEMPGYKDSENSMILQSIISAPVFCKPGERIANGRCRKVV